MSRRLGIGLALSLGLLGCGGDDEDDGEGEAEAEAEAEGEAPQPQQPPTQQGSAALDQRRGDAQEEANEDLCPEKIVGLGSCCDGEECLSDTGAVLWWCCDTGILCWINCPKLIDGSFCAVIDDALDCYVEEGGEGESEAESEGEGPCNDDAICGCDEDASWCGDCAEECVDDDSCADEESCDCADCA